MHRSLVSICLAATLGLSGCGLFNGKVASQQLVFADAQAVLTSANNAVTDYGIAKGIAQVASGGLALAGQGVMAAGLNTLIAAADTNVIKLQALINAGQIDLVAIQTLVATINAQVQALRLQAAPAVHVVPNAAPIAAQQLVN